MPLPATASRDARRMGARAVRTLSALALVGACAAPFVAHAQESGSSNGGPIVIAGPGEKNPAELQAMAERISAPAPAAAPRASVPNAPAVAPATLAANPRGDTDRFAQAARADGAIVIPGAGEAAAQPAAPVAAATNMNAGAPGMMRVSLQPASRQVMPVMVAPAQAVARQAGVQPIAVNPPTGDAAPNAAAAQLRNSAARNGAAAASPAAAQASAPSSAQAAASPAPAGQQDGESIRRAALAYLQQQSAGLPGKVDISVASVFPRGLAACTSL
ncbi:MAG TPA: flagellar basal body P-ring formation protein FlgA, partial [Paraburkholderia sp.]|nr:flagellar basal body P-ring formation protein FlgA [Paraburkholderia sp.]